MTGTAKNSQGQAAPGLPVRIPGQPWLALSTPDGSFRLLAPTGTVQVALLDLRTGDSDQTEAGLANPDSVINVSLSAAPTGPRVSDVTPSAGATSVSRVTPVVIQFTKPINPGTIAAMGFNSWIRIISLFPRA